MNPRLINVLAGLITSVLLVAAIAASIKSYGSHRYDQGKLAELTVWQQRENDELAWANARIVAQEAAARAQEQHNAQQLAAASQTYQESLQHEKATHDRTVADLRTGALRLRIELARRQTADGGSAAGSTPGPGRCDGETRAELSTAAAEFLVGLAAEADTVVHQLTACQAVVIADRQINQPQGEP
jgi:hypothetical protein